MAYDFEQQGESYTAAVKELDTTPVKDEPNMDVLLQEFEDLSRRIVELTSSRNHLANMLRERMDKHNERYHSINDKYQAYLSGDITMKGMQ